MNGWMQGRVNDTGDSPGTSCPEWSSSAYSCAFTIAARPDVISFKAKSYFREKK